MHNNILILHKALSGKAPPRPGFTLEEHLRDDALVQAVNETLGRVITKTVIQARFARGLRFYVLREQGRVVASTWTLPGGERFFEELGLGLAVPEKALWLRDVFVAPCERGRGLFAVALDALRQRLPATAALWSDLRRGNRASLHAHLRYGFDPVARYEVVHFGWRFMLRLRWPRDLPSVSAFKAGSRLLLTGEAYRALADARRA